METGEDSAEENNEDGMDQEKETVVGGSQESDHQTDAGADSAEEGNEDGIGQDEETVVGAL